MVRCSPFRSARSGSQVRPFSISVYTDYVDYVLALNGFPHDRLTLEITESALGGDPDRAERCVRQLRARGLRISIDDFGVGYSSMSQLLGLAIDELKIDKSFVLELTSDPRAQAIVRSAVEVARALDLTIVAEGIEREEILHALQAIGADIGQGYAISYPLTSRQLNEYLAQRDGVGRLLPDLPQLSSAQEATSGTSAPPQQLTGLCPSPTSGVVVTSRRHQLGW